MADEIEAYRIALKRARAEFDGATSRLLSITLESQRLGAQIGKLKRTITALAAMCSESPWLDALGITDSCLEVMETETEELTTNEVIRKLEGMGFDLSSQKNPAASVHAILSRLATQEKITKVTSEDGSVTWQGPNYASTGITDDDIPF